eukprot:356903-Amorphochlora_amoeboformis.AAC.1
MIRLHQPHTKAFNSSPLCLCTLPIPIPFPNSHRPLANNPPSPRTADVTHRDQQVSPYLPPASASPGVLISSSPLVDNYARHPGNKFRFRFRFRDIKLGWGRARARLGTALQCRLTT